MKLHYSPGACSFGIHASLEKIGKPYDKAAISPRGRDQHKSGYAKGNPKSNVPTLVRDDGSILTESPAIAFCLTQSNPPAGLLPDDTVARVLLQEGLVA